MDSKNWTVDETKKLFSMVSEAQKEGKGLKSVFYTVSRMTGRKPNSVRNFYYAHLKAMSLVPKLQNELGITPAPARAQFVTFEKDEIDGLIRTVLVRQAKGESVRAITTDLAKGDKSLMLRYQNKYRSIVFRKKKQTEDIMRKLRAEKVTYFNPYTKAVITDGKDFVPDSESVLDNLRTITNALGDESVTSLFTGLARLAYMAASGTEENEIIRAKNAEIERLKKELSRAQGKRPSSALEQLRTANRHFLQKPDKDKIQSLGEYVSELGRLLAETDSRN